MKKKTAIRDRLAKIANAATKNDKFNLARHGMTYEDYFDFKMILARDFFKLRHVNTNELTKSVNAAAKDNKFELAENHKSKITRKEREELLLIQHQYNTLKSSEAQLFALAWKAMREWKPEIFEQLAQAMRRHARHNFPNDTDASRRGFLISTDGDVPAALRAVKASFPNCDPANERRNLNRLKKVLFP